MSLITVGVTHPAYTSIPLLAVYEEESGRFVTIVAIEEQGYCNPVTGEFFTELEDAIENCRCDRDVRKTDISLFVTKIH